MHYSPKSIQTYYSLYYHNVCVTTLVPCISNNDHQLVICSLLPIENHIN